MTKQSVTAQLSAPVAMHLFLVRDEKTLLLRRSNTGYEEGNYSVVTGHLDGGETVLAAIVREAREEAGIGLMRVGIAGVMHRRTSDEEWIDFFIACNEWIGELGNLELEKCGELRWEPIEALPPNTIPYVSAAIDAWRAGEWFSSFGCDAQSGSA